MAITFDDLDQWLKGYFTAWQSNDADDVRRLFSRDAVYFYGPFREPTVGRERIVANWVADPQGQRDVHFEYEPLAINSDVGIAHWKVSFETRSTPDRRTEVDGILVLRFNRQMECVEHREWFSTREVS